MQHSVALVNQNSGGLGNGFIANGYPVALDFDVPFGAFGQEGEATRELYVTLNNIAANDASATEIIDTNCYISYDSFLLVRRPPVVKLITSGC